MEFCFSPGHLHNFFSFEIEIHVLPIKQNSYKSSEYLWTWSQFYLICDKNSIFHVFTQKVVFCVRRWAKFQVSFLLLIFSLFQSFVKLFKKNHISYEKIFVLNFDSWRLMWNSFFFESQALVTALCLYDGVNLLFPF